MPGNHVLTDWDIDEREDERVRFVHQHLDPLNFLPSAKSLCCHDRVIVHDDDWGTVSSSILLVGKDLKFYHQMGKPTVSGYEDFAHLGGSWW